jgi:cytochrome d ubiquinol oxidase subunit II
MDYNVVWYVLVGVLLTGYAILDGFDLGVGVLHLFVKGDRNRRILMNAIGPVWDGNEVWLITAGGALFAAFPEVYATAFSGFYLPFMLLLVALIFRAISLEFRSKEESPTWRNFWDAAFSVGSILVSILFGVAIGNAIVGFEIGQDREFQGSFLDLVTPYTVGAGVFNLGMFAMHGAIYLLIKTEGELQATIKRFAWRAYFAFLVLYAGITLFTLLMRPEMIANFSFGMIEHVGPKHDFIQNYPVAISGVAWLVVVLNFLSILNIPRMLYKNQYMGAFISSALTMAAVIGLFALGLFPNMLVSTLDPAYSIDIYNGSSTEYTLRMMFILAIIGMPFVLAYTSLIYWTYRGKTKITESSY